MAPWFHACPPHVGKAPSSPSSSFGLPFAPSSAAVCACKPKRGERLLGERDRREYVVRQVQVAHAPEEQAREERLVRLPRAHNIVLADVGHRLRLGLLGVRQGEARMLNERSAGRFERRSTLRFVEGWKGGREKANETERTTHSNPPTCRGSLESGW